MFELRTTLNGHESDVKAVAFCGNAVISVSRDGTARLSALDGLTGTGVDETGVTIVSVEYFLNSVCSNGSTVYLGGQSGEIVSYAIESGAMVYYLGHTANVCCLDVCGNTLVSGSWDNTIRVWRSPDECEVLTGHENAVWAVKLLSGNRVLSASADKTVALWERGLRVRVYRGHTDAVRGLAVLSPSRFASCSNDGRILIWNMEDASKPVFELSGHTSFVYQLATSDDDGLLVSCGEDRSIRLWRDAKCVQVITLPCVSVWSVAVGPLSSASAGDIVAGSSDGKVRIFTRHIERQAPQEARDAFAATLAHSAIGEDQAAAQLDEKDIKDPDVLLKPGVEGKVVVVRQNETLEAHQYTAGTWIKIGEVVGRSSDGLKKVHDGKEWDYVFDVDIEDGAPPLKLPFNNTDNVYVAAQKFIADNSLPTSYTQNVVEFLIKNTNATQISTAPTIRSDEPDAPVIFSYSKPVLFQAAQTDALIATFEKNALEEHAAIAPIDKLVTGLPNTAEDLLNAALLAASEWAPGLTIPALDALRLAIPIVPSIPMEAVSVQLLSVLEPQCPKHALTATRGLANIVGRESDGRLIVRKNSELFKTSLELLQEFEDFSGPMSIAIASLILNLVIADYPEDLGGPIVRMAQLIFVDEGRYRLALAAGIRAVRNPSERNTLKQLVSWLRHDLKNRETRFVELAEALLPLLA